MVFGLFGGAKKLERLEEQKTALRECTESLASFEQRVGHLDYLKTGFADVWPESDIQQLRAKTGKVRQLADLLTRRIAYATSELSDFDGVVELMTRELGLLDRDLKALVGLTVARGRLAGGELSIGLVSSPPTVSDCQRALIAIAAGLRDQIRGQIDELAEIKPTFKGPWPEQLDLGKVDVGIRDISDALDIYRERLPQGELAIESTATLWEMIDMMEYSIETIQKHRGQLAMHTLTVHMMDNLAKA